MDPIGLNVGEFYLTALDEDAWLRGYAYRWAVRESTTGDSIGEVVLRPDGSISVENVAEKNAGDPTAGLDTIQAGLDTAQAAVGRFAASLQLN